jgi:hypothetical protein
MPRIDSAFRTVSLVSEVIANQQAEDILNMVSQGWRIESSVSTTACLYYILRKETP